jgi:hypothetical protein
MKKIMLLLCFALCLCGFVAKTQTTYDVFTYTEPKGYKKEVKTGFTSYTKTDSKTGTYCIISLYTQSLSTGDLTQDFDNDWASLVATPLSVTAAPQKDNGDEISGWKTYSGGANFEFSGSTSMALLTTAKKDNANVAILIVTNSQSFLTTDVDAFFAKLKLEKPLQSVAPSNTIPADNSSSKDASGSNTAKPSSIIGEWLYDDALISILYDYSGHANGDTYNNDVKMSIKNKLTIKTDGTYEDYTFFNKGTFKKKEITARGKYKLNGNTITFTPTYHQYIKNDAVQPKDDTRNLKVTSATYSFVFDDKANAWGVKLNAADANSYFPDEVYLQASAYKKTASATQPAANTTLPKTINANTNNLLSDNGIAGVWVSYNKPDITQNLQWNWLVFFNNGKSLQNMPGGGFYNLPKGSYYDVTRNTPDYWPVGSYTINNGNGKNKKRDDVSYQETLQLIKSNQLNINGTNYFKCINVNGQKLNGSFTSYANPNDPQINTLAYGEKPVLTFTKEGKFKDEGLFNTYLFDGATNPAAAKPGNGTYELKDYSIILKYDDGRVRQEAFTIPFSNTANDATIIFINRAQINKIK